MFSRQVKPAEAVSLSGSRLRGAGVARAAGRTRAPAAGKPASRTCCRPAAGTFLLKIQESHDFFNVESFVLAYSKDPSDAPMHKDRI